MSMLPPLFHHGMMILGLTNAHPALSNTKSGGTPYGATHVSGARHVALKITNIDEAFLHIKSMPDTRLINETDDYQVFQISETYPDEVHFFDQDMKEMDERKQQTAKILSEVRYFYFIDKYGLQWEFEQGHTDIGD